MCIIEIEISHEAYEVLEKFRKKEESLARKARRNPPIVGLSDEELYTQAVNKPQSVEDAVFSNL